ncbi:MAG TPA: plasmid pRiA4b ORF-3 family protein, partial [Pirellulales bacterium]|nr:plasmid pRiA4b ORF-3 family protein [Pirellulales bacterium]
HVFDIRRKRYGDPELIDDGFIDVKYFDSRRTRISKIVPKAGQRFSFTYEYDFGDRWNHEILFEGCPTKESGKKYPLCLDGERACPPEDAGGLDGYEEFLEAIRDKTHDERAAMFEWVDGWFDPDEFDPQVATKSMRKGLPNWREME